MKVIVELELAGQAPCSLEVLSVDDLKAAVSGRVPGGSELHLLERDKDEELCVLEGRTAMTVIAHACRRIATHVQFEEKTHTESFPPSATIFTVLRWAVSPKGFSLDDTARAKANLILPGASEPLPREALIGRYALHGCQLTVDLTLKDFTNG